MSLLNIFKKKDEELKKEGKKKEAKPKKEDLAKVKVDKEEAKKEKAVKKEKKEKPKSALSKPKKEYKEAYRILISPHISEKGTILSERGEYLFKVSNDANKIEIKKAVEGLYGVNVKSVNIINIPRRRRRMGRIIGWKKGYKKAIVKLEEGQKIELFSR